MTAGTASLMKAHFAYWTPYFPSRRDNTEMRSQIGITSWICHRSRVPIGQSRRILVFEVIQFSCIYLQSPDWMQASCYQTQSIYHPQENFHRLNNCCSQFRRWLLLQFYSSIRSLSPRFRHSVNDILSIGWLSVGLCLKFAF